jgi:transposase-like protein
MANAFAAPLFQSHENARDWLESQRWPDGPICSHCGTVGHAYKTKKPGWYRCAEKECRKDFTVTTGTVMERSHIALHKWLMGFYLMSSSKKGVSAHQLHRSLGLDYKSAWFMAHRIREAMRPDDLPGTDPLGGKGRIVEADETYFGQVEEARHRIKTTKGLPFTKGGRSGPSNKRAVVTLVERGGRARSFHPARRSATSCARTSAANRGCTPTKAAFTSRRALSLRRTKPSRIRMASMCATPTRFFSRAASRTRFTPIRLKAIFRSSSAA